MRGRWQGRPHPRGTLPEAFRARWNSLGAHRPVIGHAPRWPRARAHRDHRFRRAAGADHAARSPEQPLMDNLTLRRPDDWHLHLRDGDALGAVLPHTAAQFARAIVMPNLKPPVITTALALA